MNPLDRCQQRRPEHSKRRSRLSSVLPVQAVISSSSTDVRLHLLPRNQSHKKCQPVGVHHQQMSLRIVSRASPVHPSDIPRVHDRPFHTRRRKNSLRPRLLYFVRASLFLSSGFLPHASSGFSFSGINEIEAGCVGHASSPGISLFGAGRSSTGSNGCARHPIQHKHPPHLGSNRHCRRFIAPGETAPAATPRRNPTNRGAPPESPTQIPQLQLSAPPPNSPICRRPAAARQNNRD